MQESSQLTLSNIQTEKRLIVFFAPFPDLLCIGMFSAILPHIIGSIEPGFSDYEIAQYTGYLESIYLGSEIIGSVLGQDLPSGYIGDKIGIRPVINYCNALFISGALVLGFSKTWINILIAKVLFGLAGGIVPNLKGYIRYVTDDTNISNLYVYLTLCLTFCAIIGPVITSFFMNPKRKFGGVWDNQFWGSFPMLLPVLIYVFLSILSGVYAHFQIGKQKMDTQTSQKSFWKIFNPQFTKLCILYGLQGFLQKGALVSITVFCKTIKENSGAGLLDYETGIVLTIASLIQSLFQFLMLPKIINKLGAYKTIILLGLISPLGFLMVRFVGQLPQIQIFLYSISLVLSFGILESSLIVSSIAIINSIEDGMQGQANGFAMSMVGCSRGLGYLLIGLLFSWSINNGIGFPMDSFFTFAVLVLLIFVQIIYLLTVLDNRIDKRIPESDVLIAKEL